mgnify:FL=1|jgi:hypothetical protein
MVSRRKVFLDPVGEGYPLKSGMVLVYGLDYEPNLPDWSTQDQFGVTWAT